MSLGSANSACRPVMVPVLAGTAIGLPDQTCCCSPPPGVAGAEEQAMTAAMSPSMLRPLMLDPLDDVPSVMDPCSDSSLTGCDARGSVVIMGIVYDLTTDGWNGNVASSRVPRTGS
ncbi:hypothetical protein MAPG_05276 [Magnaporthiopsis poae ATCC 64411]|uniref:Uncharacterized protein n=1 Tax=Magnaporthiopsis poae (strain ATCC 64411 / 73-15) TaxID=644358 RepID=A0A0C4DYZ1_MAGP6|nr:hypothetical protein MAPG_05276 [Magnaporthiopsis poae ATCC 64411]